MLVNLKLLGSIRKRDNDRGGDRGGESGGERDGDRDGDRDDNRGNLVLAKRPLDAAASTRFQPTGESTRSAIDEIMVKNIGQLDGQYVVLVA
jgi:hypothetical protein